MKKAYSAAEKETVVNRYIGGESVMAIHKDTGISRQTIYRWIENAQQRMYNKKGINLRDVHFLKQSHARQQIIIDILRRSPCSPSAPLSERYVAITSLSAEYSESVLCDALSVAKGSYYNFKLRGKHGNTEAKKKRDAIAPLIKAIYDDSHQIYGPGKVHAVLKDRGYTVSVNVVASIMHENNWFSIRGGAKALYNLNKTRKENLLNQQFHVSRPNEVWVSDVTEIAYKEKRLFLCIIMDLYARKIIAFHISDKNNTSLTKRTFNDAYRTREPNDALIFHSDQGSNYVSRTFCMLLKEKGVSQSFSRGATPYDNSVCETFFSILKQEEFYRSKYKSEQDLRRSIFRFMLFYNTKRPHSLLRYRTPDAYEATYFKRINENVKS